MTSLVVNTSATLPAAVDGKRADGAVQPVHVSTQLDDGTLGRRAAASRRQRPGRATRSMARSSCCQAICRLRMRSPYPDIRAQRQPAVAGRADHAAVACVVPRPVRPAHRVRLPRAARTRSRTTRRCTRRSRAAPRWPAPGRPFTAELLVRLMAAGVTVAPIVLHCGVSSPELHEPPQPERYVVPEDTARLVNSAVWAGRRVVAVGTTVVRALETCATDRGTVVPDEGWTDLVLGPDHPARVVTGLISGLHPPEASHLLLLEAVAGAELVQQAYEAAVRTATSGTSSATRCCSCRGRPRRLRRGPRSRLTLT